MSVGPGDWVECIDPEVFGIRYLGIYCVESMDWSPGVCWDCGSEVGLELVGSACDPDWAWCVCQFRPIYRPKSEIIQSLLQPAPELEDA